MPIFVVGQQVNKQVVEQRSDIVEQNRAAAAQKDIVINKRTAEAESDIKTKREKAMVYLQTTTTINNQLPLKAKTDIQVPPKSKREEDTTLIIYKPSSFISDMLSNDKE